MMTQNLAEKYTAQRMTRVAEKRRTHPVVQVGGNVGVEVDLLSHVLQFTQACRLQGIHSGLQSVTNIYHQENMHILTSNNLTHKKTIQQLHATHTY